MPTCPVCSSEMVYPLLNTLRCKRCKHIWKVGEEDPGESLVTSPRIRKKTDPLETRMEKKLDELLARHEGKFCINTMTSKYGDISFELFRSYLRQCMNDRTLAETKDRYGRTWYFRP
jgi:hypothetical protein